MLENVGGTVAPNSPYKFNKRERFSILFDEMFQLQSILAQGVSSAAWYFSSEHGGHVKYLGTTAAAHPTAKARCTYCTLVRNPLTPLLSTFIPAFSILMTRLPVKPEVPAQTCTGSG